MPTYAPGLATESFDMTYCRLVLMHLKRPLEALLVQECLATPEEVQEVEQDMARVAADETTLLGLPLTVQVWAVK